MGYEKQIKIAQNHRPDRQASDGDDRVRCMLAAEHLDGANCRTWEATPEASGLPPRQEPAGERTHYDQIGVPSGSLLLHRVAQAAIEHCGPSRKSCGAQDLRSSPGQLARSRPPALPDCFQAAGRIEPQLSSRWRHPRNR